MSAPINAYGDKVIGTSGSHGSDISSQRMDDLDKAAIHFVMNGLPAGDSAVCDIGCGAGSLGFRLSLLGARVEMYDLVNISSRVAAFRKLFPECRVQFFPGDARQTFRGAKQPPLGAAYSQRFIHYMPYQDAKALFIKAAREMTPGAKFFVSASGLDSELGDGYAGKALPLMERFHALSADMAEKHEIKAPVCLYREEDIAPGWRGKPGSRLSKSGLRRLGILRVSCAGNDGSAPFCIAPCPLRISVRSFPHLSLSQPQRDFNNGSS